MIRGGPDLGAFYRSGTGDATKSRKASRIVAFHPLPMVGQSDGQAEITTKACASG